MRTGKMDVKITDNSKEILNATDAAIEKALEMIGIKAERYAKLDCPVDTGLLRNSISHAQEKSTAYIGTNVEYAPYVELGTGIYADNGKGRQTPWLVTVPKGAGGKWAGKTFVTRGMKASHFLRNAATNHSDEYRKIVEQVLKGDHV